MKNFFTKAVGFFKRNAYYCLLAVSVLAIGALVTVGIIKNNEQQSVLQPSPDQSTEAPGDDNPDKEPDQSVAATPIVFALPLKTNEVLTEFSLSQHVWNETLKRYEIHDGIDFAAAKGDSVYVMYDGTVTDITTDLLHGTVITVDHGDGLTSIYASLDESTAVKKGDRLKKGDYIGSVSDTAYSELLLGNHLHIEVQKNGEPVDPSDYIVFDNK